MDPSTSESCASTGRTDHPVPAVGTQENNDLGSKSPRMEPKPGRAGSGGSQASIDSGYNSNVAPSTHPSSLDPASPDLSSTASTIKPFQRVGENAVVYLTEDSEKHGNESSAAGTDTTVSSNDIPAKVWPHQAVDKDVESSSMVVGKSSERRKDSSASITSFGSEGTSGDGDVQKNETLVKEQQHQIGALQNRLRRETSEREALQKQVTKVTEEKVSLEAELANVQRNFESEVLKLEGQLQEKTEELEKCKKLLAEKEFKLEQMRTEHPKALQQAEAKAKSAISRLRQEHEKKIKELEAKQAETEKQKDHIEITLWKTKYENEAKIGELKHELLQAELDLTKTKKEVAEKKTIIATLEAELKVEKATNECEMLRRNSADKDAKLADKDAKLADKDAKIAMLEQRLHLS